MQKEMDKNERRRLNKLIEQGEHDDRKEKSDLSFNQFYMQTSKMKFDNKVKDKIEEKKIQNYVGAPFQTNQEFL